MPQRHEVCVIIAARDAEATIGAAVRSALAEAEVTEVIVVDDASRDGTARAAVVAAAGDPRLRVLARNANLGPAAARNLAIRSSTAPFVAILDADDRLVPGRFAHLFGLSGWDLAADNIAFVHGGDQPTLTLRADHTRTLDLAGFVRGNLQQRGFDRGELGFLKPVIRRDFLDGNNLAYDPTLRLGEDYDLYVRCLLAGARFQLSHRIGYVATVRGDSLSARHTTGDLGALLAATNRHLAGAPPRGRERNVLRTHQRQTLKRYLLRAFLDRKAQHGLLAALGFAVRSPSHLQLIATGVLADKMTALRGQGHALPVRSTLIPLADEPRS